MKILARYIMTGANGAHLERVACTIDLKHATVELLHPTASVFEEGSAVEHFVEFDSNIFALVVDSKNQRIALSPAGWSNLKHSLKVAFSREKTEISFAAIQEFRWFVSSQMGPYPADEMSLKAHCFVEYDTGEVIQRDYPAMLKDVRVAFIAVSIGTAEYAVKMDERTELYCVVELEKFKTDIRSSGLAWTDI